MTGPIICFDARTVHPHFPGIGRYARNLGVALASITPQTLVVVRDPTQAHRWAGRMPASVRFIDSTASPFALRQQWVLPGRLRAAGVALYHSPYYLMPLRPGMPSVVTIHDLIPLRYPQLFSPVQRLMYGVALRLATRVARVTLAVSTATAGDLTRLLGVPRARIVTTVEAADPIFQPQPLPAVAALRSRLKLPEQHALYVGSNKPHKNLVRLVEAWTRLRNPLRLVIAGPWDPRFPDARQRAEGLGLREQIAFVGPVAEADLPALYSSAMLFVFPSCYEGFGLPVIEAMACGVPVACARAASLPEVAGEAAVYFDPHEIDAIADAVGRLQRDEALRTEMAQRARDRAAQFSWEHTARLTLAAYERALA